ncbi:MAG: DUF502 domain-containing protein [Bacteroidota bacterium]|nr:DUF502 domain-containing protein [Bacteroidota bacterium]MDP4205264.1 DUF502 domain-containing protein [Bacteroidota bacterium]
MKRLVSYFAKGILLIAPLVVTIIVIVKLFIFVDGLLKDYLQEFFGKAIPGVGILLIIALIIVLGFIGQTIVAKPVISLFDRLIKKLPLLNLLYSSLSDLFSAFVGKERKFNKPVMVLVNSNADIWKLGFVTQENLEDFGIEDKVAVYFPYSYSFLGEVLFVPKKNVKNVNVSPPEVMKFVVSGGVTKVID